MCSMLAIAIRMHDGREEVHNGHEVIIQVITI